MVIWLNHFQYDIDAVGQLQESYIDKGLPDPLDWLPENAEDFEWQYSERRRLKIRNKYSWVTVTDV